MRKLLETVLAGALLSASVTAATLTDSLALTLEANPGQTQRVILLMKDAPGAKAAIAARADRATKAEAMRQNAAIAQSDLLGELESHGFTGSADVKTNWLANAVILDATPDQIKALELRDDVATIELNGTVQLPPVVQSEVTPGKRAEGDTAESTWGIKSVKALEAQSTYGVDGSGVVMGILDTGYDGNLPSLAGRIVGWKSFISDSQTEPMDDNGHGTHCAGSIGGTAFNGMEIGVAPGVSFVAGKILSGSGSGSWEGVIGGMEWIVDPDGVPNSGDEPVAVSNSWGGSSGSAALHAATKAWHELGIAPIFAAGNSGPGASTVGRPGGYPEAYAVGANAVDNTIASFSSRGPVTIDGVTMIKPEISAPGKDVTSLKANKPNETWTISGTSMATPHVAGLAALLFQANPDLTMNELFEVISSTSTDMGPPGQDNDFGHGRIDAMAALAIVISGGKVNGSVVDADGAPVTHANVVINETGTKIRIKADGSFRTTLPEGEYTLAISAFGFVAASSDTITITAGEDTNVAIVLDRAASGTVSGTLSGAGAPVQGTLNVLDTPLAAFESGADGAFSVSLPAGSYTIAAAAYGFDAGVSSEFTVTADENTVLDFDLAKLPPVLVVDDDKGKGYEAFYTAALGDTAHNVLGSDQLAGLLSGGFLSQYEVVVWLTGDDSSTTLTSADQTALGAFLDNGGRLFISGQDIGYNLKSKAFYAERLGATYKKDTAADKTVSGGDLSFAIEGGDGANNQKYPDVIEAAGNGSAYLAYGDGTTAAVKVEAGNSKVIYLGFGFEAIDTAANRAAMMASAMGYLSPSAEDMAARVEAISAKTPATEVEARDQALLTNALLEMVGTAGADSSVRSLRRSANFEGMNN